MKTTGLAAIVTALIGSAHAEEPEKITYVIFPMYSYQVAAEDPKRSYLGKPTSVGASAKIVLEEPNQDVIGNPKRTYIVFPEMNFFGETDDPQKVELAFYATSGTAWSSKNNKMCGRPLTVEVLAFYSRDTIEKIHLGKASWEDVPTNGTLVGTIEVNEPCTTSVEYPHGYTVDVTVAYASGKKPTAFMLKADAKGELDPKVLPTAQERWDNQTDVYIGTPQQGLPPSLTFTK